jgi:hypothetical protein
MLLTTGCHSGAIARLEPSFASVPHPANQFLRTLLRFGTVATRATVKAALPAGARVPAAAKALHKFADCQVEPLIREGRTKRLGKKQLETLVADLWTRIIHPSDPPGTSDEVRIYCFASRLSSLPLGHRRSVAPPDLFRFFSEILGLIPRPPLIDAICTTIDAALREPAQPRIDPEKGVPEQLDREYAALVCGSTLARALCDIVVLGVDYASYAVFGALRYCIDSPEFQAIVAADPLRLIRLAAADEDGHVRRAAQELHGERALSRYSALPFPKPDFPLAAESMH